MPPPETPSPTFKTVAERSIVRSLAFVRRPRKSVPLQEILPRTHALRNKAARGDAHSGAGRPTAPGAQVLLRSLPCVLGREQGHLAGARVARARVARARFRTPLIGRTLCYAALPKAWGLTATHSKRS
jgi:hypothetical protein